MTTIRLTLPPCPHCGRDAAHPFERTGFSEALFFVMCDPARRGCGACTDGAETIAGAVDLWITTRPTDLSFQRRVAA